MEKSEILKQIEHSAEVFKKALIKEYYDKNKDFYGISMESLDNYFTGKCSMTMMKDGSVKVTGCIPKECFRKDLDCLPRVMEDYSIFPLVINLFQTPDEEDENGKTKKSK